MFKIESYVTPILLSYVDKYVRDFKPANAQVSLWGGGVALHNLVLKPDVLQQEVSLPFTLVSGRIHELLIQVPWTKIMSEPIVVTIDTIECVLNLKPPEPSDEGPPPESPSRKSQVVEAPPGYMQALVRRIVSNISLRVHHLIVKYVQDDIVLSLNVKHMSIDSAGVLWEPAFADIDQIVPVVRRLVKLDDLTLCLDKADADGKIRYYQEPLLYRCQLDLRVLTRLVSASTRRAASLSVSLRSEKLAWSVTCEQLALLLRLARERPQPSPPPPPSNNNPAQPNLSQPNLETVRASSSWTEWAWSWLPAWADRPGGEDVRAPPAPLPLYCSAYVDDLALLFKVMEVVDGQSRKRPRSILEVGASHAAVKSSACIPTSLSISFGARNLSLQSHGKCVCGATNYYTENEQATVYLKRTYTVGEPETEQPWSWPKQTLADPAVPSFNVETAQAVDEAYRASPHHEPEGAAAAAREREPAAEWSEAAEEVKADVDELWASMGPLVLVQFSHERAPSDAAVNPYEDPPKDFEYSDWVESCQMRVKLEPLELRVCMGLVHRLMAVNIIFNQFDTTPVPERPMRVLTVEECESLTENIPERRVTVECGGLQVRLCPWNHCGADAPAADDLALALDLPHTLVHINGPLYPHRVCSAACQMPSDSGALWQAARVHVSASALAARISLANRDASRTRVCALADLHLVTHLLLHKIFFLNRQSVHTSFSMKISEMSISGSSARLQAAWHVLASLLNDQLSFALKHSSLPSDALNDEEAVAIDLSVEELTVRGYLTQNIRTVIVSLHSARATALHEPFPGEVNQAWLFSAPDAPTTTPYLRMAGQWCDKEANVGIDFLGFWTEPIAISIDPMLIAWLAYQPFVKPSDLSAAPSVKGSVQFAVSRRTSSGRSSRTWAGADMVHAPPRQSAPSSSEPSEKVSTTNIQGATLNHWWEGDELVGTYQRLRDMLVHVELGLALVYVTTTSVSAVDCGAICDAMERHALDGEHVLVLSLGRFTLQSNVVNQSLWQELRHDGPTISKKKAEAESFPWKIHVTDMSCYTLEAGARWVDGAPRAKPRTRLGFAPPRTVLEPVTTAVTLSVVTRNVQIKNIELLPDKKPEAATSHIFAPTKTSFFTSGLDFKPTTLKEFFRGPLRRSRKESKKVAEAENLPKPSVTRMEAYEKVTITDGPVLSLGVHVHADTPPVVVKLDRDQINLVGTALHCFNHIVTLLKRPALDEQKTVIPAPKTMFPRSVSENDPIRSETESKSSELIEIFDRSQDATTSKNMTTFFWCQWVVSQATVVVASQTVKLAFTVDDVITSVDLQPLYNQLKVKLASASIKHYVPSSNTEWKPGVMGGRVLEARETATGNKDEDQFLAVTITLAHISNLPDSWKQELHPKLLEKTNGDDSMWEIYATLAPLEAIIQPLILENITSLVNEMMPADQCPLKFEPRKSGGSPWLWPFCYLTAGGIRLLVTGEEDDDKNSNLSDDTLIFSIERVSINPHPDNPICRRLVNAGDASWLTGTSNYEGRQYEFTLKQIQLVTGKFQQLVIEELEDRQKHNHGNPALKWTRQAKEPDVTPLLYHLDISFILAPAMYTKELLTCGPAVEVNLTTDCVIDLSIEQIVLVQSIVRALCAGSRAKGEDVDRKNMEMECCPYASVLSISALSTDQVDVENPILDEVETTRSTAGDSGVETVTSVCTSRGKATYFPIEVPLKKSVSIVVSDPTPRARDYLEVFLTMGTLELSLFVAADGTPEVDALKVPSDDFAPMEADDTEATKLEASHALSGDTSATDVESTTGSVRLSRKITEGANKKNNIPLLHANLQQPNVYYWGRKDQRNLQISLFNAWIGRGTGLVGQSGNMVLFSTAKGTPDPVTDIPPALATLKIVAPTTSGLYPATSARGSVQLDVERPVQLEVSTDRINLLASIYTLMKNNSIVTSADTDKTVQPECFLYNLRQKFLSWNIESACVATSQVVVSGSEGALSWSALSAQAAAGARPPRVAARALLSALAATAGPHNDTKHIVLHPLIIGAELEALWEAWRRAEGGPASREPGVVASVELDRAALDLRPADLAAAHRLATALLTLLEQHKSKQPRSKRDSLELHRTWDISFRHGSNIRMSDAETNDHYYKDDLRSGAFKMSEGAQLPMAYQVLLHGSTVSWRYPHPRALTRLVAFPLPGLDKEVDCVLELFTPILGVWEPHTYFKIPVGGPSDINLQVHPPDTVFATTWRFRCCRANPKPYVYEFNADKFMPRPNPLAGEPSVSSEDVQGAKKLGADAVSAEQLSGVLRVDSYFAPRVLPRTQLVLRTAELEVHLHNAMPAFTSQSTSMEGYYVSRPLMRSHRVLSAALRGCKLHARLDSPAGLLLLADTKLSANIMECSTGTIESLVGEARVQAGLSTRTRHGHEPRARVYASPLHLALTLARMRTLQVLAEDWAQAVHITSLSSSAPSAASVSLSGGAAVAAAEAAAEAARALEGRVSLWVHNSCVCALRVGQEGTDELVPLGPGVRLAYRWRSPTAPKRLHFALANPSSTWQWSASLPFAAGCTRVKLEDSIADSESAVKKPNIHLYVKVEETGAKRVMHLCGLLYLANMLRYKLLYKIRARNREQGQWGTVCSGEMEPETVGWSVLCAADAEIVLKIKFANHEAGWSGDIPLKECPKENVPWLVKVPSDGDVTYISAWCRVSRGRSDGQVVAAVWPLYVLRSHLPLDTDVLVMTESGVAKSAGAEDAPPAPLVQSASGRGSYTHLLAPGTTASRHNLSFQYRNIQCPVMREEVPLHYGVTNTSVFDKRAPVMNVDEVLQEIVKWRKQSSHKVVSSWPYSIVSKHWHEPWRAALLQPRCDVSVRYGAVRAGGGCSLLVQLCPVALMCNAAPLSLTLRAHDAGPLCVLQPGSALLPPSNILTKPFFMSVEIGRETFVSEQLQVSSAEPGRYGTPPRGHLMLDHATRFSVLCNQKVALLTLHYEIKEDINVLGITPTYVLINRLDTDLQVSTIATPIDNEDNYNMRVKTFKLVKPTKNGSMNGTALCRFTVRGRWRGGDEAELHKFVHLALPAADGGGGTTRAPAPVCLDQPPTRRAVGLIGDRKISIPVTVSQLSHEGRCLVVVAHDSCPQFLIQNLTKVAFCVGQPVHQTNEQPSTSKVLLRDECFGTRWWCVINPDTAVHYSTPQYCERYPPPQPPAPPVVMPAVPMLAFGRILDDSIRVYQEWSAPVAVTDGEQLLQFHDGVTVKLRVTTHPHTSLLVLKDTDHHDISASDIRRRLNCLVSETRTNAAVGQSDITLERNWATSQLFERAALEYEVSAIGEPRRKKRASITMRTSPEPSASDLRMTQPPAAVAEPSDKPRAAVTEPSNKTFAVGINPSNKPPAFVFEPSDKPPVADFEPLDKPPAIGLEPSDKTPTVAFQPSDKTPDVVFEPLDKMPAVVFEPSDKTPAVVFELSDKTPAVGFEPSDKTPDVVFEPSDKTSAVGFKPSDKTPDVAFEPSNKMPAAMFEPPNKTPDVAFEPSDKTPDVVFEPSDKTPAVGFEPSDKTPTASFKTSDNTPAVGFEPSDESPAIVFIPLDKTPAVGFESSVVTEPSHAHPNVTIKLPGDKPRPRLNTPPSLSRDRSSQYPETSIKCTSCRPDSSKVTPSRAPAVTELSTECKQQTKPQETKRPHSTSEPLSQTESRELKCPHFSGENNPRTGCRDPLCPNIIQVDKSHTNFHRTTSRSHDFKCPPCERVTSHTRSHKVKHQHSRGENKSQTGSQDTKCLLSKEDQTGSRDTNVSTTLSVNEPVANADSDRRNTFDSDTSSFHIEDSVVNLTDPNFDSSVINLTDPNLAFRSSPAEPCAEEEESRGSTWRHSEYARCVVAGVVVSVAVTADVPPLFALHLDRTAVLFAADNKRLKTIVSIADVQVDNLQYETGQYDFAVVASTRAAALAADPWPPLWNMFAERGAFGTRRDDARLLLNVTTDTWGVLDTTYKEITEVEVRVGSLALYVEDAYVKAVVELSRLALSTAGGGGGGGAGASVQALLADERALQRPLRLRLLHIHPLNLTLTLHTAVRMYIALDQSPLRLSAFQLHDMMTSSERLTHALTVHYLSAAILGAGWVVGGLELLGAPGAIAARLGEARGGVKGVASAAAAALLRSLSAWAGSLARNLDLLAGDEEHARRAAAARRRPPASLVHGLLTGITNFAINILGAVGGLAHHPLVGAAVGESDSGALALRRGLVGALAKPLSATADLLAFAGHGLLQQTGWDPVLQPRLQWSVEDEVRQTAGWRRDCVRWTFRLAELHTLAGFEVMFDNALHLLLITHKYLVFADPETERIIEMIDLKLCTLAPYQGPIISLSVLQSRKNPRFENRVADEDDEYQISPTVMARVARYTGAAGAERGAAPAEARALALLTGPGRSHALYAALAAVLCENTDTHFSIL